MRNLTVMLWPKNKNIYKLMKVGIFLELDTTNVNDKDVAQVHFGIIEAWLPFYARLPSLCIVRGFALLAFAHEILN